jgi:hypothetical protein
MPKANSFVDERRLLLDNSILIKDPGSLNNVRQKEAHTLPQQKLLEVLTSIPQIIQFPNELETRRKVLGGVHGSTLDRRVIKYCKTDSGTNWD